MIHIMQIDFDFLKVHDLSTLYLFLNKVVSNKQKQLYKIQNFMF